MRTRALAMLSAITALFGIVGVVLAQARMAAIASIYTLQPGEQIITQVAYPIAPWPAVSIFGVAVAVAGALGLVAIAVICAGARVGLYRSEVR